MGGRRFCDGMLVSVLVVWCSWRYEKGLRVGVLWLRGRRNVGGGGLVNGRNWEGMW